MPLALVPRRGAPKHLDDLRAVAPDQEGARESSGQARAGATDRKGLTNGGPPPLPPEAAEGVERSKRTLFGRQGRRNTREGPGFLTSAGATNGSGLVNGGGLVNGRGRVNGAGLVNGRGQVNGGGRVNGGRVNGGRVNGGRVNGGRVNGGRVNGGRINGGAVNGRGFVNGSGLAFVDSTRARRRALARNTAVVLVALLIFLGAGVPFLYNSLFGASPIAIDGDFSDWAAVPTLPDAVADQVDNGDINLVAFAATHSSRDLYYYVQVPQGFTPFKGPGTTGGAESFRLLIDADRSAATGYAAFGLGVDAVVELTGYNGQLRSSTLRVFPAGATDRTNPDALVTAGAARAVARGNQLEGSLSLSQLGLSGNSEPPFLLLLTQDSLGRQDVGDIVFSPRPGVLALTPNPVPPAAIPTNREVPLLDFRVQAYHENVTLTSLYLTVDGASGGGLQIAYVQVAGRNLTMNASGLAGGRILLDFAGAAPLTFDPATPQPPMTIFGRATGAAGVGAVRLVLAASQDIVTGAPAQGFSGHGSALPPLVFERSYVAAAPSAIHIDGAFADWESVRPFDDDPDNDVTGPLAGPSPGGPNPPSRINQNIDIRQSRMDSNTGLSKVSFYLEVDGSILSGPLLHLPEAPTPTQPSQGGGGGAPGGPSPVSDIATVYVDADHDFATGWQALPNLGVDKVLQIVGSGGGYGRTARVTETSIWTWDPAALRFNKTDQPIPVGLGSSKLETQVNASDLCLAGCGAMRYAFYLQDNADSVDYTVSRDSNVRGGGEILLFSEGTARSFNTYPGEQNVPILSFGLYSPSTNENIADLVSMDVRIEGIIASDVAGVSIFRDSGTLGVLESSELAQGALAQGALRADGTARLVPTAPVTLAPGSSFQGLITADIAPNASTPAWLNASIGRDAGVHTSGVASVHYALPAVSPSVRLLADSPGARGQNDLIINEVNVVSGFIEVYDTTGAATNLTSPATMGLEIYSTNPNSGNFVSDAIIVFSGFTNSEGFAAFNYTTPYTTATRKYFVAIWCSNCTAGQDSKGKNNASYVSFVQMPTGTSEGAWGRYPDGNSSFSNTTNNTRADNNAPASSGGGTGNPQNNLKINEVNFVSGWIEVYVSLGFAVNLTSPSQMGLVVYRTNALGANAVAEAVIPFRVSTNAEGFAVVNYSIPYSTSTKVYHVAIWCSNCTAGRDSRGRDNGTALDDVTLPQSTGQGAWGRFPDGGGGFVNTTNNTRGDNNAIPEFFDFAYPVLGIFAIALVGKRRGRNRCVES